jgi:tetratricopeptide (TPR) repeat protein
MGCFTDSDGWAHRAVEFEIKHQIPFAEALGNEFLGENSVHKGDWERGLEYAAKEAELAEKIHSRERRAWVHLYSGSCILQLGDAQRAEREFIDGIALAEAVGDRRAVSIMMSYRIIAHAELGLLDEALVMARQNFEHAESTELSYLRTEAHRCLALVHFKLGEFEETVRLSERIIELTASTDARVSKLWAGPPHIEALLALSRRENAISRLGDMPRW